METSSLSARDAAKALKCAVRCRARAVRRSRAAVSIFSQSALFGRDGRAADPVGVCGRRAGLGVAEAPLIAPVAGLAIRTAVIAVVVSIRLRIAAALPVFRGVGGVRGKVAMTGLWDRAVVGQLREVVWRGGRVRLCETTSAPPRPSIESAKPPAAPMPASTQSKPLSGELI